MMRLKIATLLAILHTSIGSKISSPITYTYLDGTPIAFDDNTVLKLSSDGITPSVIVLDYGQDVEGYATFDVTRKSGDTSQFEMTYSETRALLNSDMVSNYILSTFYISSSKLTSSRVMVLCR